MEQDSLVTLNVERLKGTYGRVTVAWAADGSVGDIFPTSGVVCNWQSLGQAVIVWSLLTPSTKSHLRGHILRLAQCAPGPPHLQRARTLKLVSLLQLVCCPVNPSWSGKKRSSLFFGLVHKMVSVWYQTRNGKLTCRCRQNGNSNREQSCVKCPSQDSNM